MSEAVQALGGASYSNNFASIREVGVQGMLSLRGELGAKEVAAACKAVAGSEVPARRQILSGSQGQVGWMSPDELLFLVPRDEARARLDAGLGAVGDTHALLVDVSDMRAVFELTGRGASEVLAKIAPVDLDPSALVAGELRRTRLAQVPGAFWRTEGGYMIVCFRSVAQYVFDLLAQGAAAGPVGYYQEA